MNAHFIPESIGSLVRSQVWTVDRLIFVVTDCTVSIERTGATQSGAGQAAPGKQVLDLAAAGAGGCGGNSFCPGAIPS